MSLKKFKTNDIILNTMKTHPECEFFVFDGVVYYNNSPHPHSGAFSANVLNVSPGFISLYEYNVDKSEDINPFIYPFILCFCTPQIGWEGWVGGMLGTPNPS